MINLLSRILTVILVVSVLTVSVSKAEEAAENNPSVVSRADASDEKAVSEKSSESENKDKNIKVSPEIQKVAEMMQDRIMGDKDAPVTILEYSSFTCGHCSKFHTEIISAIKEKYIDTGKAKLIFRDFPLDGKAAAASMLSRCAPEDKYYSLINVFFSYQTKWAFGSDSKEKLTKYTLLAGLSQNEIDECIKNELLLKAINGMRSEGMDVYGIRSTPTIIISNGKSEDIIRGAAPVDVFMGKIEKMLAEIDYKGQNKSK